MFEADQLRRALASLGEVLRDRGCAYEIVVVGGGALLLLGTIQRPTRDLDALAIMHDGTYTPAQPLPEELKQAIADVGNVLGLSEDWLDTRVSAQLHLGLPEGFHARTSKLSFGALTIHVAGRFDQICLKLYAAADHSPGSKHVDDLLALAPLDDELARAAQWVKTQDGAPEFARFVDAVIEHIGRRRHG